MSKTQVPEVIPEASQPAPEAGFLSPVDPHAGRGGSYLINPDTGARDLIERTAEKGQHHVD